MNSIFRLVMAALAVSALSACAIQAPRYSPSLDNVEQWKKVGLPVSNGVYKANQGASSISLRGTNMSSPVGESYATYLADALQQELTLAGRWNANSNIKIEGLLLKNDIAAAGISTNSGEIEARFSVLRDGVKRYDDVKRAEMTWDSSFMGSIAIPKAQQQYPLLVQQLIAQLLADSRFQAALQ